MKNKDENDNENENSHPDGKKPSFSFWSSLKIK